MSRRALRIFVTGRVQGVGFRAYLIQEANALALDGWARNRADGSVESLVAGPAESVAAFAAAARRGPIGARVDELREAPAEEGELAGIKGFGMAATV